MNYINYADEYYDDYEGIVVMPTIFDDRPIAYTRKKDWKKINKENAEKKYSAIINDLRKNNGLNLGVLNYDTDELSSVNDFKGILALCSKDYHIPVIVKADNILSIVIPKAVDRYFKINNATKVKLNTQYDGQNYVEYLYFLKVPENLIKQIKTLCAFQLSFIQACIGGYNSLEINMHYDSANQIKLKNTLELDEELLDSLLEVSKQVEEYQETLSANLDYYNVIKTPNFSLYRVGKTLLKNLSISEKITKEYFNRLAPSKKRKIQEQFLENKGLGMLSLNEKRLLEAVLILVCNSQIIYATEVPTTPQKFCVSKEIFIKEIVANKHLKNRVLVEELLEYMGGRSYLLQATANHTTFKTGVITKLFEFKQNKDSYLFTVTPYILREILAIEGSGFFVKRQRGFYDNCENKVGMSTYNLLDYLDYLRNQPHSNEKDTEMTASLPTLLSKMGLIKYQKQGFLYMYKKFIKAIEIAIKLGFIRGFSIPIEEFKKKIKANDTSSLSISVINSSIDNDLINVSIDE